MFSRSHLNHSCKAKFSSMPFPLPLSASFEHNGAILAFALALILCITLWSQPAQSITANKVWFEFHPHCYRVLFQYTVPELKEAREGSADFKTKEEAEKFYWNLVRGADFYLGDPGQVKFLSPAPRPQPW